MSEHGQVQDKSFQGSEVELSVDDAIRQVVKARYRDDFVS